MKLSFNFIYWSSISGDLELVRMDQYTYRYDLTSSNPIVDLKEALT